MLENKNTCSSGRTSLAGRAEVVQAAVPYLQRPAAAVACSKQAPRGRSTVYPTLHSLCRQLRHNEKIALLLRCPLRPKRGRTGKNQKRGGKGACACSSSSSSSSACDSACLKRSSCLQHACLQQRLFAAARACSSACLQQRVLTAAPQRLQQQHCSKQHTSCISSSSRSTLHAAAVVPDVQQQAAEACSSNGSNSSRGTSPAAACPERQLSGQA